MAILSRLSEETKSYIDVYMNNAIKKNVIAPLEIIMIGLPSVDERSVISYVQTNYPGYLVIDFEPYRKLIQEAHKGIDFDDVSTSGKITQSIMSKDNFIE